ncbi:MAG: hypothetical protein ABFE02_09670, partial [Sulfuricella sp.]
MADKNQILTDEQIGLGATKPAAPKTLSDSDIGFEPPARGFKGWAQDVAATAVKGAIGVPEMLVGLADIPTGGRVGKFLENEGGAVGFRPKQAKEMVNDWHSDATKEAQRKFQQADGFMDKAVTAIQNPSTILTTVGESIPSMLAGGLAGRGLMATTKLGTMGTKGAALAGAAGEGLTMAGSAAEQIRQETEDGLLTPGQAAAAGLTGVVGAGLGALGGRVANKLGIGDVDTMIAQGAKGVNADVAAGAARAAANPLVQQSALRAIPTKVVQGAISEGFLEELPQSVAEQVFQNLALGKDWHEDVDAAAVMGVLSGSAMGGAASGFRAFKESGAQSQEPGAQGVAGTDPAQPQAPSTGLQRVQSAFEAQLRALQEQEQGEPEVPQTAPPSGAELTAKQRAAALANRAADIDRDRSTMGPDDEIFQSTGMAAPLTPSQQMGLRSGPEAGTMEAAAALAVDTGAAGQMQQAAQAAQTAQQQQKGKGKQAAQAVDTETGEIVGAEGDFTTWSDQDLSNTFRSAQSRDVRLKLAKELARRREERDQAELRAELEAEQTALDLPNVDDGAFARMTEDAGDVPAELSQPLITNEGAQLVTQAPQAQQSQTAGQEAPDQGRAGAAVTASQGGGVPAAGTAGMEAAGLTQSVRPAAAPEGASPVDALRTQLREVEDKILRAAPGAMAAGGGDIEAAMKSPKVPVTLKAQRKKLKDQMQAAQPAGESGDGIKLTPAQKREIEAGGTGFVGELGESARSSLQAMRNNPKVPVIKTDANGGYFNDELPQYTDIGSGFSVRGYSVRGDVKQEIKLPNGMVITRTLKADGGITGSAEGNYDQIVEGKGFAEAEKMVADYFAGRRPEAQTRALPAPKVEDGSPAVERGKNGYAKVKIGRAQHFVTPYNDHFVIRDRQGNIVRGSDSRQLQFATESEAISYAEKSAASTPSLGADDITMLVRKAAHADERPGDVMLQTYEPTFITLEQAVAFARQYMSPSDWDKPFQFNRVLDIAPRDWGRMVKA